MCNLKARNCIYSDITINKLLFGLTFHLAVLSAALFVHRHRYNIMSIYVINSGYWIRCLMMITGPNRFLSVALTR